jgi:hypothetical protein
LFFLKLFFQKLKENLEPMTPWASAFQHFIFYFFTLVLIDTDVSSWLWWGHAALGTV